MDFSQKMLFNSSALTPRSFSWDINALLSVYCTISLFVEDILKISPVHVHRASKQLSHVLRTNMGILGSPDISGKLYMEKHSKKQ